jgi:hypothetical protein
VAEQSRKKSQTEEQPKASLKDPNFEISRITKWNAIENNTISKYYNVV